MKKKALLIPGMLIVLGLIAMAVGNVQALLQDTVYLPVTFNIFCLDFFDDFSSPSSGWYIGEDEFAKWEYLDGEYRILSKDDSYYYWDDAPTCARDNYSVEVEARWVGDPGNSYGILIGNNLNFDLLYSFEVNTDFQDYSLFYWDGNFWYTIIPWTVSPHINVGTASNHLKVTRNENQLTLQINGNVLGTWSGSNITGPTYTAVMSDPYNNVPKSDARFDNFRITSISLAPLSPTALVSGND